METLNIPVDLSDTDKEPAEINELKRTITEENDQLQNRIDKMTELLSSLIK